MASGIRVIGEQCPGVHHPDRIPLGPAGGKAGLKAPFVTEISGFACGLPGFGP
jgi:hypothetical protein